MSRSFLKNFTAALIFLCATVAHAHDFEVGGIYYRITDSPNKTAEVTYKGGSYDAYEEYSGNVVIPASVAYNNVTYSVTSVGEMAFRSCIGLTSITIPNSVTSIGESAFYYCPYLTSVEIPNSVTSIADRAFGLCSSLTSITIPNSVISIGMGAFGSCSRLTSIEIPNSVTSIAGSTFSSCSRLTSIEIPNGVTSIGERAFDGCSRLTSIEIPNSVTSIGRYAFYKCSGLTSIEIPNSVTSIGERVFNGCSVLTSIVVDENNTTYDSRDNCNAIVETESNTLIAGCKKTVIPGSVISIGEAAFSGCSGLKSITIPSSVTSIGEDAFKDCEALYSVVFTQNAISIESSAFENTEWFKSKSYDNDGCLYINNILFDASGINEKNSYKVKEGTVSIAELAFSGCSGLTSIEIPNSVKIIAEDAFSGCSGLERVELHCASVGDWFSGNTSIKEVVIGDEVTSIAESAFSSCSGLTSVTIGNSVTSIAEFAFSGCGLTNITIPNSVTSIGGGAFQYCSGLTSIEIPNSVTSIGDDAFYGASIEKVYITDLSAWCKMDYDGYVGMGDVYLNGEKIVNLVIPDDVKVFNNNCFNYNQSIKSVKIGDNLESMGQFVFDGCNNITEIYIESKDYLELYNAFEYNVRQNATVYVSKGRKDDYNYIFNPDNIVEVAHTLKYVIDGNVYKTEELGFGETIPSFDPVKEGYTFCGWEEHPATMPNNDLTVNGSFKVNQYTVTYLINGDTYKTETYDYGAAVLPIEDLQRKGYTFSGWSQTLTTMPAMDVVITSSLTANKYTIKYMVDGFTYATREYEYGELILPLSDPSKNGYMFAGWNGLPERMPANDIVVTADFVKSDTAIDDVNSDAADVVIYDLNGNRIINPTTGVYIINGKKVFVK